MAYNPDPSLLAAIQRFAAPGDRALALATTLVESGGRLDAVGDGGQSHGPYQEYTQGRGAGLSFAQRRDPAASTQRFLRELASFKAKGLTGAELAYATQRPADRAGYIRKINAALPIAQQLLAGAGGGGGGSSFSPPAAPGLTRPEAAPQVASPQGLRLTPGLQRRLQAYLEGSREDVLAGRTPRDALPIVRGIAQAASRVVPAAAPSPVMDFQGRTSGGGGHHAGDGHDHGYESGGVDSGKAFAGGLGGDWGGSMPLALSLAKAVGLPVSSQKRSRQLTASGGVSDHWTGSTTSYAVDLATSGSAGDRAYVRTMNALGLDPRRYPSGRWHNVNIGGYRYQIGWRTPGHFDHIHVGVKKL